MRRPSPLFAWLFCLPALLLFALSFLPFAALKSLADGLMSDGHFESLKPGNVVVFRGLFATGGIFFLILAALTFWRGWSRLDVFLRHVWQDGRASLRGLHLPKSELPRLGLLLVVLLVGLAYRFEYLYASLHHDEAYTCMAFARSLHTALTDYHLPNNHVFHSVLVYLSGRVFGYAPWAVRLPAFTAGLLLIPAIYLLGKRHYNPTVGLGASLLVAISPAIVNYSDNARGYTLVALFGLLLLVLARSVRAGKNRFAWALIVLFSALGMYTVPVFLFPFGVAFLWMFWENWFNVPAGYTSPLDFLKYWLASGLAAAALTLLLYLPILIYTGPEELFANGFVAPVPWPDFLETLSLRLSDTWTEWTFRVPLAALLLLAAGLLLGLLLHKKVSSTRVLLQVAAAAWIVLLLVIQRPNAWGKVWFGLLPLVILWAAAGLWGGASRLRVRAVPLAAVATILLLVPVLTRSAVILRELPRLWALQGDEEQAVLFVGAQAAGRDALVVAPPDDASVWYYAELHGLYDRVYAGEADFDRLFVLVNPAEGQTAASVIEERGPALSKSPACALLETVGKIQIFDCMVSR